MSEEGKTREIKIALVVDTSTTGDESGLNVYDVVGVECVDPELLIRTFIIQTKEAIPELKQGAGYLENIAITERIKKIR